MALGYELEDLLEEFDPATLDRARKIRRQGKIVKIEIGDGWLRGKVQGSTGETYKQDIEINRRRGALNIQGECSCPMDYNCKHVAALLLEALERQAEPKAAEPTMASARPINAARPAQSPELLEQLLRSGQVQRLGEVLARPEPKAQPAPEMSRELEIWLQSAVVPQTERVHEEAPTSRLLFLLDIVRSFQDTFLVVRLRGIKLAQGRESGKPTEFRAVHNLTSLPRYAQPDKALLARLTKLHSGYLSQGDSEVRIPAGLYGDETLRAVMETGRAYWKSHGGTPLAFAGPRRGRAAWHEDAGGTQRPGFAIEPKASAVLPLNSLWYVDAEQGQVGPLETPLSPQMVSIFLRCPPVPPDQAEAFSLRFPEALRAHLPAPKAVSIEEVRGVPVPHLRLFAQDIKLSWDAVVTAAFAEPGYLYGERLFKPSAPMGLLNREGDKLTRLSRDAGAEKARATELNATGLRPVRTYLYQIPRGLEEAQTFPIRAPQTEAQWLEFVSEALPKLRADGWAIQIDPGFPYEVVESDEWFANLEESGGDWFGLELGILVEGQPVNLIPVLVEFIRRTNLSSQALEELADESPLYPSLPDGRRLRLEAGRIKSILGVLIELYGREGEGGRLRLPILDAVRLAELEAALQLRWHGGERLLDLGRRLREFGGVRPVEPPAGLRAELRPYQLQGLAWLQFLREYGLSGVLADDMGLGKTLQTLAHLLLEKDAGRAAGPSLVVAPTSVVHNWHSEAERFAPDLRTLVLHGKERRREFEKISQSDVVFTTYPLLLRDLDELKQHPFHLLVLDEAQYIKNARSGAAQAASGLRAVHRLALTGTPLENHLGELWSLFNFLMPGFLGDGDHFKKTYRNPIEKGGDALRQRALATRVRPFMLRRTKERVAAELPPKSEFVVKVDLEPAQRDLYETLRVSVSGTVQEEIARRGLARSQIMVLDALLKLRQACCDPRLLALSAAKKVKQSAKLEWLKDNLPQMLQEGRRVLLFSQFATMLGLLEPLLEAENIPYLKLTGETTNRAQLIRKFQDGEAQVFLISLKAGGVGLNLTAADTVIHYDPWWNPAAENQATDRAHRIGQTKPVFVYKLIASGSVEEKIIKLQERKAALAAGILEGSLGSTVALTPEDLSYLLAPLE
ncbi:MAG: DEAD/DEAH box helicase [Meiothermus sp.]|nr:DEAD/DEAH box helicase [Meiothermus sp.]